MSPASSQPQALDDFRTLNRAAEFHDDFGLDENLARECFAAGGAPAQSDEIRAEGVSVLDNTAADCDHRRNHYSSELPASALGFVSLARMLERAGTRREIVPGMLLVGVGIGLAYAPVLGAVSAVAAEDAGASSGIVNTSFAVGGALSLAALATAASARTNGLLAMGAALSVALEGRYRAALLSGTALAFAACLISGLLFRARGHASAVHQVQ